MQHLFAYGTLMCADILHAVCGERHAGMPALLRGFARRRIRGEHYPGIFPLPGDLVEGVLYRDISPQAWRKLDLFEGETYRREALPVEIDSAGTLLAGAYVMLPHYQDLLEKRAWDFEQFLAKDKQAFLLRYAGFRRDEIDHS